MAKHTKASLAARVRELEQLVDLLANHSAHMMYNQVNERKPFPTMDQKATDLEVRARCMAWRSRDEDAA